MSLDITYTVERNPIINIKFNDEITNKILCIGDPHLGRRFITGVPSSRMWDRENTQYAELRRLLNPSDPLITHIVIMGDLFDRFIVSPTTVLRAVEILREASLSNLNIQYYVIPGNHDMSKDNTKKSSYELFYQVFSAETSIPESNLNVFFNHSMVDYIYFGEDVSPIGLYFQAYNAFKDQDYLMEISERFASVPQKKIAFGHWDSVDIIQSGHLPDVELLKDCDLVVSGHEHVYKKTFYPSHPTTPVLFTGSMQPYSHAEDPLSDIYITVKAEDLSNYDLKTDFQYKCLRIECKPSFVLPEPVECYSLSYKVITQETTTSAPASDEDESKGYAEQLLEFLNQSKIDKDNIEELKEIINSKEYLD